uniref:Uncharacterized protein n=1 Tax=Anguilla anguilla TaxID=7936 RepID=A0A0E9X366_ANGAN
MNRQENGRRKLNIKVSVNWQWSPDSEALLLFTGVLPLVEGGRIITFLYFFLNSIASFLIKQQNIQSK